MKRFLSGSRPDPSRWLADHSSDLFRFCERLCRNADDAEDLAQDAMVLAIRNAHQLRDPDRVGWWLRRIAFHRWLRVQQERRRAAVVEAATAAPPVPDPAPDRVNRMVYDRAVASLPDRLRLPFELVRIDGFKYREAAELLELPTGTVQCQVHEAMRRLQEWYAAAERMQTPKPDRIQA
jgi:RNA polymerase sigma-70 factor, ECF subfamily